MRLSKGAGPGYPCGYTTRGGGDRAFRRGNLVSFVIRRGAEDAEDRDARSSLIQDSSDAWANSEDASPYLDSKRAEHWQHNQ